MYLNLYVPSLQSEGRVATFFREHRGQPFASSALMEPISQRYGRRVRADRADSPGDFPSSRAQGRHPPARRADFPREEGQVPESNGCALRFMRTLKESGASNCTSSAISRKRAG